MINKRTIEILTAFAAMLIVFGAVSHTARINEEEKNTGIVKETKLVEILDESTEKMILQSVEEMHYYDPDTHKEMRGLIEIDGAMYFFDLETGIMVTGFCEFDERGNLAPIEDTAGLSEHDTVFYFDEDGKQVFGEKIIGEYTYFFLPQNGRLFRGFYVFRDSGQDGGATMRYYDKNGRRVVGEIEINGEWYYFDQNTGKVHKGFRYYPEEDRLVYYDEVGHRVSGEHVINGFRYIFDDSTGTVISKFWEG